jgi:F-type H+-transporting ATPase subunit a
VAAKGGGIDPIHQFEVKPLGGGDFTVFGVNLFPTNSTLWMAIAVGVILFIVLFGSRARAMVPGRLQTLAEMAYEFVENLLVSVAGREGMRFFPFVFSLFMFVFLCNTLGMIPGSFTVTSQIIVTGALSFLIIGVVVVVGIREHGSHFFGLFVPSGVPGPLLPFIVLIEVISFISRPISLALRLFGNMLAGHIALKLFGSFVAGLIGAGAVGILAPLPLLLAIGLTALEFLIAFLQAYVFAMLASVYLNDALHPGH